MAESIQTTNLGPLVSLTTTESANTRPLLSIPSTASLEVAGGAAYSGNVAHSGNLISTSTINQTALGSKFLSKQTTASYTSLTLADGELTIGTVSVSSCRLVFRSGATTYEFWANRAAIL